MTEPEKKLALLATFHKKPELTTFARWLIEHGYRLIASGGTAKYLRDNDVLVQDVTELVGGKAILGHRVVTLSREIAAALLCRRDNPEDMAEMQHLDIQPIDLVFVDLYPMKDAINKPNVTREEVIELTDIGGPTLIREAAKGGRIVLTDYSQLSELMTHWPLEEDDLNKLAANAELVIARYCADSAEFHSNCNFKTIFGEKDTNAQLAYGENRWQKDDDLPAYFKYVDQEDDPLAMDKFELLNPNKPIGVVNFLDLDRALQTMTHITAARDGTNRNMNIAVAVKHGNPCGAAIGFDPVVVAQNVVHGDPLSLFGGVVMTNFTVTQEVAEELLGYHTGNGKRILAGIAAPDFDEAALSYLGGKGGKKCKLWTNPNLANPYLDLSPRIRSVRGGFLIQPNYTFVLDIKADYMAVHESRGDALIESDLLLAWAIGSTSNSNTITIVKNGKLIGNGVGQQDRVGSAELAIKLAVRSAHDLNGAVAYSDSFFPFPDGIEVLAKAEVKYILASSGSIHDNQVITRAKELGVTMYLVPDKIGRGFAWH